MPVKIPEFCLSYAGDLRIFVFPKLEPLEHGTHPRCTACRIMHLAVIDTVYIQFRMIYRNTRVIPITQTQAITLQP